MWRRIDWWYWLATVTLLSGAVVLDAGPLLLGAIGLTALQILHFSIGSRGLVTFPIQVRIAYLLLLLIGAWPPLGFIHWIQVVVTWTVVVTDYCLLARCLSLLPWNRVDPLTRAEILGTFLRPSTAGSVMQGSVRSRS
jgi:hypothetical protein